jgi:hypothetical protein
VLNLHRWWILSPPSPATNADLRYVHDIFKYSRADSTERSTPPSTFTGLSFCALHGSCSESCSLCYEIHVLLALPTKARILCLDSL